MFYVNQCHQQAETELNCLLASEGIWGKYIAELQSKNKLSLMLQTIMMNRNLFYRGSTAQY